MRKIKLESWKAKNPEGKDVDENLCDVLNVLIANKKPEDMPRGLDKARMFNRLVKAFDQAKETKMLILEEVDYTFLKDAIEKDMPSQWGASKYIMAAVESFIESKQETKQEAKMGTIEKLENGRHIIRGGFSTAKKEDVELIRPLIEKNLDNIMSKKWDGVSMGKPKKSVKKTVSKVVKQVKAKVTKAKSKKKK